MSPDRGPSSPPETRPGALIVALRIVVIGVPLFLLYPRLTAWAAYGAGAVDRELRPFALVGLLIAGSALMLAAYAALVRIVERRWPQELSARPGAALMLGGTLYGALLFAVLYAVFFAIGVAGDASFRGFDAVPRALGLALISAVCEEAIVRGAVFRPLEDAFGTLIALALSGALFGVLHAGNPAASAASTVAIAIEAGLLLGIAYTATRSLWFPIGIHFGWNFTEGGIFGAVVSGFRSAGIFDIPLTGSDLLTGGRFGPEMSIVSVLVCLAGAAAIGAGAIRSGRWRPIHFTLGMRR